MNDGGVTSPGTDLFGIDPAAEPLAAYFPPDARADAFGGARADVAAKWKALAAGLFAQCRHDTDALQAFVDRHVEDLGLAFRMAGDEQERPWPLNPMPILIGADEWATLSEGLIQRARLLEAVIADAYGPQQLVADGHLPAAVLSGSGDFARRMVGVEPPGGRYLHVLAVDLARQGDGQWRVLADRVRLPVGIGYALENRLAMTRATGGLLASLGTERQSPFLDALRQGLAQNCERTNPRIALLTPGRFNQAYPEQALLARHLGFSLVEGRDLMVRSDKLYVRTIAGLKRIDAVWRWIVTRNLDPLNFDARSEIGVPNIVSACRHGLVMANWPGAGVVESRAMPAFLPRLARIVMGEDLKLPNVSTWWCGGEAERGHVLDNLDRLVISSAFRNPVPGLPDGHTRLGASLSAAERDEIVRAMALRPMDYTAQELVELSTTPALVKGRFEPRGFTVRAFICRDAAAEWVVMPGGFARISESGDLRTALMGRDDMSSDVCIVANQPPEPIEASPIESPPVRREQGLLPSQAADNLYWLGRYGERGRQTVLIVRALLEQFSGSDMRVDAGTATSRLCNLLRALGAAPPESVNWLPMQVAATALSDRKQPGSIRSLSSNGGNIGQLLRDRLARDSLRLMRRPMPRFNADEPESMAACCDLLVERYAAHASLTADGMSRTAAWNFLDLGVCVERASMVLQAVEALVPGSASAEDLSALLDLMDAQTLYRSRYLSMPTIAPVLDLILLDPEQPRGLAMPLARIEHHLASLPVLREDGMPEAQSSLARQLCARVEGLDASRIDTATLTDLRASVAALSDAISTRFFIQDGDPAQRDAGRFLA